MTIAINNTRIPNTIANGNQIGQKHHHQEILNTPVTLQRHNNIVMINGHGPKEIVIFLLIILSLMVHILNYIVH